jgi:hypothetical protein
MAEALNPHRLDADARSVQLRHERVELETARHRIVGTLTLAQQGYRSRISDMLNATERDFVSLTDADITPLDGGPARHHAFVAIHRAHIVFAVPLERDAAALEAEHAARLA